MQIVSDSDMKIPCIRARRLFHRGRDGPLTLNRRYYTVGLTGIILSAEPRIRPIAFATPA